MKSKGRRRVEAELLAMRDEAQQQLDKQRRASKQGSGSVDGRRYSEESGSQLSTNERRGRRSTGYAAGAGAATDDSFGERDEEEEERAPFSSAPITSTLSASTRLAMAERELAEVTAQRDAAMELLESSRLENARLSAELDRAKSYKALYTAAHHEHKGMKASLAASTQICMGQQRLIQMLQQASSAAPGHALDPDDPDDPLAGGPGGVGSAFPPSPPPPRRERGVQRRVRAEGGGLEQEEQGEKGIRRERQEEEAEEEEEEEEEDRAAAAAIALARASFRNRDSRGFSLGGAAAGEDDPVVVYQGLEGVGGKGDGGFSPERQGGRHGSRLAGRQDGGRGSGGARRSGEAVGGDGGGGTTGAIYQPYDKAVPFSPDQDEQQQQQQAGSGAGAATTIADEAAAAADAVAAAHVSARQAIAMRAASSVARETAMREGMAAAGVMSRGGGGVRGAAGAVSGGRKGGAAGSLSGRPNLLDDDLISHSSLRREYDDTFLNQPLRGEHRRGEQSWMYGASGGDGGAEGGGGGGFEGGGGGVGGGVGGSADQGAEADGLAGIARARTARSHLRERGKTKSGSQSSVSTVASTTKSTKAKGPKDERAGRKGKSERSSARDGASHKRGTSPRPSAPRQARTSQRLSSGTFSSHAATMASAAGGGGGIGGGGGLPAGEMGGETAREPSARRSSAGSSVRLSSRKR